MTRMVALACLAFFAATRIGVAKVLPSPEPGPPTFPTDLKGKDAVKEYLTKVVASAQQAAAELKGDAILYSALADRYGSPAKAASAQPQDVAALVVNMRNDYKRIDSFGYEYIEGIVAGVPALMKYDVELDSGVPEAGASSQDLVPDIHIHAGGVNIDRAGSLNNFLIEPTVYGTNEKFTDGSATLPGFDKAVKLPNPKLMIALADYAIDAYGRLDHDANAWTPTDRDLFVAMVNMTPTLADYFDEWKESKKYGQATGGRFVAVSRVSDMRGIMKSTQLNWEVVQNTVSEKDQPLAEKISDGYTRIMKFIDTIDQRDRTRPLKVETIDALGTQAKDRADKLTVQVKQAAALIKLDVDGK